MPPHAYGRSAPGVDVGGVQGVQAPDFFIVGAPRCGTTFLWTYLGQHPQVYMPGQKEFHFFGSDLTMLRPRIELDDYLRFFSWAPADAVRHGEASPLYLRSTRAAREIREFCAPHVPQAIALIRNPVDMIHSFHSLHLFTHEEDIDDLDAALEAEPDRARGRRIPKDALIVEALLYRGLAHYAPQLQRYFDELGRENVHVIVYDDLRADSRSVLAAAAEFLGLDAEFPERVARVNSHRTERSRALGGALSTLTRLSYRTHLRNLPVLRRPLVAARDALRERNTARERRQPLGPELRARLQREFAPWTDELSELLGRDLSHWYGQAN